MKKTKAAVHTVDWFAVTLLFTSRIDRRVLARPLCEARTVLLRARSTNAARKAAAYARGEEFSYKNSRNETVSWRFERILDIEPAPQPNNGSAWEVSSSHFRVSAATLSRGGVLSVPKPRLQRGKVRHRETKAR